MLVDNISRNFDVWQFSAKVADAPERRASYTLRAIAPTGRH